MPWEIVRLSLPILQSSNQTRSVDLYTKAGGIGAYGAMLALSPDHDIGFAILAAGPSPGFPGQIPVLAELALSTWIPAAEAAGRKEAGARFSGVYVSEGSQSNSSDPAHSVVIILDPNKQGLSLTNWTANGFNILQPLGIESIQLYPVGLADDAANLRINSTGRTAFRGVMQRLGAGSGELPKKEPQYLHPCSTTWLEVDTLRYGGLAIDEFVFEVGDKGDAVALEIPVLRIPALKRKSRE